MNILIVSPAFAPYSGVGSNRMVSLSKFLMMHGHNVIIARNDSSLWPKDSLKSPVPDGLVIYDIVSKLDFSSMREMYKFRIQEIYSIHKVDIAIYSCNPYYTAPVAVHMKKYSNADYIIEFRDLWIKDEFVTRNPLKRMKKVLTRLPYIQQERLAIKYAKYVVTVTESDKMTLSKNFSNYKNKIRLIYNGYDDTRIINSSTNN